MAKSMESTGKTVDEAIFNGLDLLGLSIDEVDIEILDEGSKGLFGIGASKSKVRLTEREEQEDDGKAKTFLDGLLQRLQLKADIETAEEDGMLKIRLKGPQLGMLIGRRGETLDALQYLTSLAINRGGEYTRVQLDVGGYRQGREETLTRLAERIAIKVDKTGEQVTLEPMNPYERRVLHAALQNNPRVVTKSDGEEPNRRVTIMPKK